MCVYVYTHTNVVFCEKWGHPIGVMVFILYKPYVLLPYTNPRPTCSPHRTHSCLKKTHSVWFRNILKSGDMGQCRRKSPSSCNTYVIPMPLYECMSSFDTHTHTHAHAHTRTHTHTRARTHAGTHAHTYTEWEYIYTVFFKKKLFI